jgi:dolichol-phosphate mannosyltransferase
MILRRCADAEPVTPCAVNAVTQSSSVYISQIMLSLTPASSRFARELLGYGIASAAALAADVCVLMGLVTAAGWHYLPASVVAFVAGAAVAYLLSTRFVFRSRRIRNGPLELVCFVALGGAGLLVNSAALFLAVSKAGMSLLAAKLVGAVCTFATNLALRRQLLFAPLRND